MKKLRLIAIMVLAFAATAANVQAQETATDTVAQEHAEGIDMPSLISHHIANAHSWNIFAYENEDGEEVSLTIPLPVMAYYDGQFLFTLSSSFDHGAEVVKDGNTYSMHHDKLVVHNAAGEEAEPFDFSITKNVASMFLSAIILLLVFIAAARSYKKSEVPRGGTSLVEMLVLFVKDIGDEQIGKEHSAKYTSYLLTIFYFIWINNLLGLIPFFPGGSNLSGNISFTAIMAVFTFFVVNINGSKSYWKHNLTVPGVPAPMKLLLVPIEIISLFTKPFTLLIRLFANVTGGHIIIISLISMIFIVQSYVMVAPSMLLALLIFVLELVFGALQAYIFTLLSALYIGLAVQDNSHH